MRILGRIRDYLSLVRFEHTIFALPFAYIGTLFAWRMISRALPFWPGTEHSYEALSYYFGHRQVSDWLPPFEPLLWITLAVIGARTAAMAINRIVDARMDAENPRTMKREIPTGRVSVWEAVVLAGAGIALLVVSTAKLSTYLLVLLPLPALFIIFYSFTKRFTSWCHVILGATDGFAPLGGVVAMNFFSTPFTPPPPPVPVAERALDVIYMSRGELIVMHYIGNPYAVVMGVLLFGAVTLWVGGFDIYYSIQDLDFDRANKVFSLPARWGVKASLIAALVMHLATVGLLWRVGYLAHLNNWYYIGMGFAALTLVMENAMVWISQKLVGVAFFTANGILSIVVLAFTALSCATSGFPRELGYFLR